MRSRAPRIDGYAIQNTAHVLHALGAYAVKARSSAPGAAIQAAIDSYAALSHRRVTGRTVRRWLSVVKSYRGIEKVPENAFGARKRCPHVARPSRKMLREIAAAAKRLAAKDRRNVADSSHVIQLAALHRAMMDCVSAVENNPLRSICRMARHLEGMSIPRLYRFMSAEELQMRLTEILGRFATLTQK